MHRSDPPPPRRRRAQGAQRAAPRQDGLLPRQAMSRPCPASGAPGRPAARSASAGTRLSSAPPSRFAAAEGAMNLRSKRSARGRLAATPLRRSQPSRRICLCSDRICGPPARSCGARMRRPVSGSQSGVTISRPSGMKTTPSARIGQRTTSRSKSSCTKPAQAASAAGPSSTWGWALVTLFSPGASRKAAKLGAARPRSRAEPRRPASSTPRRISSNPAESRATSARASGVGSTPRPARSTRRAPSASSSRRAT